MEGINLSAFLKRLAALTQEKSQVHSHKFVRVIIISDESSSVWWTPLVGSAQYRGSVH